MTAIQNPAETVHAMTDAWRRQDIDGAVSLMADDGVFLPGPKANRCAGAMA